MDTALANGDFSPGANGRPREIGGAAELFQRAAIRLTVPLGGFACDPSLGSRLNTLPALTGGQNEKALSFAREALRRLPQLAVESAAYSADPPRVNIVLSYGGESAEIEVKL